MNAYFFSEDDSELKSCVRNRNSRVLTQEERWSCVQFNSWLQNVTHKALRVRGVGELLKSPVADGGG